ncbi:MAG: hypothetical protein HRU35_03760 [Rickettsiaceae bacterium]|nr:hypothetical protein [Rickettsiaceae bacterium]
MTICVKRGDKIYTLPVNKEQYDKLVQQVNKHKAKQRATSMGRDLKNKLKNNKPIKQQQKKIQQNKNIGGGLAGGY